MNCRICITMIPIVAALLLSGVIAKPPSKVIGGTDAEIGEFPYQASLQKAGRSGLFKHYCGGIIISPRHILSAAHCLVGVADNPATDIIIITGTNANVPGAGVTHKVKSAVAHPNYSNKVEDTWANDIAVFTLQDTIKFDVFQKSVELPKTDVQVGTLCVASGWGDITFPSAMIPNNMMKANMKIVSDDECQSSHDAVLNTKQLCALAELGIGLCFGDSGGPLVHDGTVYGIASWVRPCAKGLPDVFTRVFSYVDWIHSIME